MKARILLSLSLVLNVGLIGAVGWLAKSRMSQNTAEKALATRPAEPQAAAAPTATAASGSQIEKVATGQHFDWRMVESEDYKKYIANLRSIGCPEETIRDIITADVNKLFESRAKEIKPANKFKFWETGKQMFAGLMDEELIKKQQALAQEKRALL